MLNIEWISSHYELSLDCRHIDKIWANWSLIWMNWDKVAIGSKRGASQEQKSKTAKDRQNSTYAQVESTYERRPSFIISGFLSPLDCNYNFMVFKLRFELLRESQPSGDLEKNTWRLFGRNQDDSNDFFFSFSLFMFSMSFNYCWIMFIMNMNN